jgi:hypothetical protein
MRICLIVLSALIMLVFYVLIRFFGGFEYISDELFYLSADIDSQRKRLLYLDFIQFFRLTQFEYFGPVFINALFLILTITLFHRLFYKNALITFSFMLYLPAISSYLFRDIILLGFFFLIWYLLDRCRYDLLNYIKCLNVRNVIFIIVLVACLFIVKDFRAQYFYFIALSLLAVYVLHNCSNRYLFIIVSLSVAFGVILPSVIGDSFSIYGISAEQYLETRSERHSMSYNPINILTSVVRHMLAPIPSSILIRLLDPEIISPYPWVDDLFRFFYRSGFYALLLYLIIHVKLIPVVFNLHRKKLIFIMTFCFANILLYSIFSFGGGHERIKLFSVIFFYTLAATIWKKRKEYNELR